MHRVAAREIVFEPRRRLRELLDLRDLWRSRELLLILAWRDARARYSQTVLGLAWALVQPLALSLAFTLSFGGAADPAGAPRGVVVFAGLLPWLLFANSVNAAATSVVVQENLITKARFPRLVLPFASVGVALLDFAVGAGALAVVAVGVGITPGWSLVAAPVAIAIAVGTALGVGSALAALNVAYRDFRLVTPFLVVVWMLGTPTLYAAGVHPTGTIGEVLALNPMMHAVEAFRAAVVGAPVDAAALGRAALVAGGLFVAGCAYFRHAEDRFADVV